MFQVGGMYKYKYDFITNLPLTVKEFWKQALTFDDVTDKSIVSCFFLTHSVYRSVYRPYIFITAPEDNNGSAKWMVGQRPCPHFHWNPINYEIAEHKL